MIAALGLLYAALFLLAGAQAPHSMALLRRKLDPRQRAIMARAGWLALALSLLAALLQARPGLAVLAWIGALPLVGVPLVIARSYRPSLARAGLAAAVVALALGVVAFVR